MEIESQIDKLYKRRATLITYAQSKLEEEDFHGVADAAMDLREVDAKLSILQSLHKEM